MFALTVDQVDSRSRGDHVDVALRRLAGLSTRLPFVRTVGDEFQGLLTEELSVVDAILRLMHPGSGSDWHIGVGVGSVELPLPRTAPSARGDAFIAARAAVERAKSSRTAVCITAVRAASTEAEDAEVVVGLVADLLKRRSPQGWAAVDLAAAGLTHAEVAERLGISRQAVSQRLAAAGWSGEVAARPVLGRLFARVDAAATSEGVG